MLDIFVSLYRFWSKIMDLLLFSRAKRFPSTCILLLKILENGLFIKSFNSDLFFLVFESPNAFPSELILDLTSGVFFDDSHASTEILIPISNFSKLNEIVTQSDKGIFDFG